MTPNPDIHIHAGADHLPLERFQGKTMPKDRCVPPPQPPYRRLMLPVVPVFLALISSMPRNRPQPVPRWDDNAPTAPCAHSLRRRRDSLPPRAPPPPCRRAQPLRSTVVPWNPLSLMLLLHDRSQVVTRKERFRAVRTVRSPPRPAARMYASANRTQVLCGCAGAHQRLTEALTAIGPRYLAAP